MVDYFKGGEDFNTLSELERIKRDLIDILLIVLDKDFKRDKAKFIKKSRISSPGLDDLTNRKWGGFLAEELLEIMNRLYSRKSVKSRINKLLPIKIINSDVLMSAKIHVINKMALHLGILNKRGLYLAEAQSELYQKIKDRNVKDITMDHILLEYIKVRDMTVYSVGRILKVS